METSRKTVARRRVARRVPPLSLSARIERLEKVLLFPRPATATPITTVRFTKLDAHGKPTTGEHVAVHDAKTGLIWPATPLNGGKEMNHAAAMQACSELDLLGHKDWRAPTIEELLSIVDYTRCDPAVDTDFFKGLFGWTWSSTLAKSPAGFAWLVSLDGGDSGRSYQSYDYRVRAVRAGQSLAIGKAAP